jgi:hypothetical protein
MAAPTSVRIDFFETFKVVDIEAFWAPAASAFMDFVRKAQKGEAA